MYKEENCGKTSQQEYLTARNAKTKSQENKH